MQRSWRSKLRRPDAAWCCPSALHRAGHAEANMRRMACGRASVLRRSGSVYRHLIDWRALAQPSHPTPRSPAKLYDADPITAAALRWLLAFSDEKQCVSTANQPIRPLLVCWKVEAKLALSDVHEKATLSEDVSTDYNVVAIEVLEHDEVADEYAAIWKAQFAAQCSLLFYASKYVRDISVSFDTPVHPRSKTGRDAARFRSCVHQSRDLVSSKSAAILRDCTDVDAQIGSVLLHCSWIASDSQAFPIAVTC